MYGRGKFRLRGWMTALWQDRVTAPKEEFLRFSVADERDTGRTAITARAFGMNASAQADEYRFEIRLGDPGFVHVGDAQYLPSCENLELSGLYNEDWTPIEASLCSRRGGVKKGGQAHRPAADVPIEVEDRPAIYLGYLDSHFGHTITEFMSRLWIFDQFEPRDFRLVVSSPLDGKYPRWMRELFCLGQLPIENLTVYDRPTRLRSVIIPRQAHILASVVWTAGLETAAMVGNRAAPRGSQRSAQPVYLSRANINPPQRRVRGEADLISELDRRKVRIVSPEMLSISEQLQILRNHQTFVGPWGSAHHMKWFIQEPSHHIYLASQLRPSYLLFDAANGNASTWIKIFKARDKTKEYSSHVDDCLNPKFVLETLDRLGL